MRFWIDIDNPPQVQYLMPLAEQLVKEEQSVVLTAREYGVTKNLLDDRGVSAVMLGREFGVGRLRKTHGVIRRAVGLIGVVRRRGGADVLISGSRSSAIAARLMRIPTFILCDYEFSEVGLYLRVGAHLVHPSVIPATAFTAQGWPAERLTPYEGIKEDLTFSGRDLAAVVPHDFGVPAGRRRVLFRPPAEESHYFAPESRRLSLAVLEQLARDPASTTIFSPRHAHQIEDVRRLSWTNEPILLEHPIAFDVLLASADLVVCAGGTMLREAAWLGVPAISIFQSRLGAVDLTLQSEGRIRHVRNATEFAEAFAAPGPRLPTRRVPDVVAHILREIAQRVKT